MKQFNNMKQGSISVYLCLTLCIILSLIFACINSVRLSTGKAAVSCSVDEALFSLFSNYDRTLFDRFGLMFIDGGYLSGSLNMGKLAEEVDECVESILSPEMGVFGTTPKKLYRVSKEAPAVTGYVLASDMNYQRVREQISQVIKEKIGIDLVSGLEDSFYENAEILSKYSFDDGTELKGFLEDYEKNKEKVENLRKEAEENAEFAENEISENYNAGTGITEVPEDFENPLDNAGTIMSLGLYDFAIPEGKSVSGGKIDLTKTVSHRELNKGMGEMPVQTGGGMEKIMICEYAVRFFSDFLSEKSDTELKYQSEYLIAGKNTDSENLKSVLNRIVLIREGLNYISFYMDSAKKAEISEMAFLISCAVLLPEYEEVIAQALMLVWAYAESLMDVKTLLSGGKVPIFKSGDSWQISLAGLSRMTGDAPVKKDGKGLGYREYLRLLMYMLPEQEVTNRTMDMIEYNKRVIDKDETFCMDNCVSDFQVEYSGTIGKNEFTLNRSFGY